MAKTVVRLLLLCEEDVPGLCYGEVPVCVPAAVSSRAVCARGDRWSRWAGGLPAEWRARPAVTAERARDDLCSRTR